MATIPPLVITEAERAELESRVRAHPTPQRAAKQARILLLAADSLPTARSPHGRQARLPLRTSENRPGLSR